MKRNVFIPHLPTRRNPVNGDWVPTISLTPAAELGEIQIACDRPTDAAPEHLEAAQTRIQSIMLDQYGRDDYIMMAGDPVLCAYAVYQAITYSGRANVLRWNRDRREYDLLTLTAP